MTETEAAVDAARAASDAAWRAHEAAIVVYDEAVDVCYRTTTAYLEAVPDHEAAKKEDQS